MHCAMRKLYSSLPRERPAGLTVISVSTRLWGGGSELLMLTSKSGVCVEYSALPCNCWDTHASKGRRERVYSPREYRPVFRRGIFLSSQCCIWALHTHTHKSRDQLHLKVRSFTEPQNTRGCAKKTKTKQHTRKSGIVQRFLPYSCTTLPLQDECSPLVPLG